MTDVPERPARRPEGDDGAERWPALTATLWAEREALEDVIFKLTSERLILQKAQRWLAKADDELTRAASRLRDASADRHLLARSFGVPDADDSAPTTLVDVAAVAPEPWASVLTDHRLALRVLAKDLGQLAAATRRQLRISGRAVSESLEEVRLERGGAAMHVALGQFRSVERELFVTAADATHRAAMVTVDELVDRTLEPLDDFLA